MSEVKLGEGYMGTLRAISQLFYKCKLFHNKKFQNKDYSVPKSNSKKKERKPKSTKELKL